MTGPAQANIYPGRLFRHIFLPVAEPIVQQFDKPRRRFRDRRAWGKNRRHPGLVQRVEILRRNDAAHDNHDVRTAFAQKRRAQLRRESQMPGGKRRNTNDVDIIFNRLPRGFPGRREQRADFDLEAKVGERGGDGFLAAIMPVLADFRNKDARRPPFVFGECLD